MDSIRAKEILIRYRPGIDPPDPEVLLALDFVRRDSILARWLEAQGAMQKAIRHSLSSIDCPPHLRARILAHRPKGTTEGKQWFRRWQTILIGSAAILVVLGILHFLRPDKQSSPFALFRERAVRAVQRNYSMEMVTTNLAAAESYFAQNQAPSKFELPRPVQALPMIGCSVLDWGSNKVSLVCYECGHQERLFVFVAAEGAFTGSPKGVGVQLERIGKLETASWTQGRQTYVLASPDSEKGLKDRLW